MCLERKLRDVMERIEKHASFPVSLLLATKRQSAEKMIRALSCGARVFGESYLQEAAVKIPQVCEFAAREGYVGERAPRFHFIGGLQRNKVRAVLPHFDVIESVDRIELAREISKQACKIEKIQSILLQVNISREETKSGVIPEKAEELGLEISTMEGLSLDGLMAIGRYYPPGVDEEAHRGEFAGMRKLRDALEQKLGCALPVLSMGMSDDFELAVEEGATEVRIGSAVFGERI